MADMAEKVNLKDFKYSYTVSSKDDKNRLIQSVHMYPNRFDSDVLEYVDYIFHKYYKLFSLEEVDIKDVLGDDKYHNKEYNHSLYIEPIGLKIHDSLGLEIGQMIMDFQPSLKQIQIYYLEFLKVPEIRVGTLIKSLLWSKYGDDNTIGYSF